LIPNLELVLLLGCFTDAYREHARFIAKDALHEQAVSQVAVPTLVERAGESNSGLD
jgi:hypothetical protein